MQLLGSYHFRFAVRNYILDAFDLKFTIENLKELDDAHAGSVVAATGDQLESNNDDDDDPEQRVKENTDPDMPKPKLHPKVVVVGGFQDI